MVQCLWKTFWQFLKTLNIELPQDPAILLLGIHPKELKTHVHTKTCTLMFIAVLFIIAKKWKQPKCPSTDEQKNKYGISLQWNIIQQSKGMKYLNMLQHGHTLKTSSVTKGYILYNFFNVKCSEQSNLQRQKVEYWLSMLRENGDCQWV